MGLHGRREGALKVSGKKRKHEIVDLKSRTVNIEGLLGSPDNLVVLDNCKFKTRSAERSGEARIIEIIEENF